MKAHQFTNEILNRKLNNLGTGPVTGLPAQGTDDTPDHSPGAGPSTARTIVHMMQNMLDDLNVMHPGLRDDVRAANDDGPGDGGGSPSSSSSSSSDQRASQEPKKHDWPLPAQGSSEAAAAEAAAAEALPTVEVPETLPVIATPPSGPAGLPAQGMAGSMTSWANASEAPTGFF